LLEYSRPVIPMAITSGFYCGCPRGGDVGVQEGRRHACRAIGALETRGLVARIDTWRCVPVGAEIELAPAVLCLAHVLPRLPRRRG
jgi:hypothetical protein